MNGPFPPIAPPKPPNIEVSHTVDVTTTAKSPTSNRDRQQGGQHGLISDEVPNTRTRTNTRTSAFAESLGQPPPSSAKIKLEPRIEPPGAAFRGGPGGQVNPEIGLISFLYEYPKARAQSVEPRKTILHHFLHRPSSERRSLGAKGKKMEQIVSARKTSDGRTYGQIVIAEPGLYNGGQNKSAYKINDVNKFGDLRKRRRSRGKKPSEEMVKTAKTRQPIESVSGDGQSMMMNEQTVDGNERDTNRSESRDDVLETKKEHETKGGERSSVPILPLRRAAESTFGVDFSSIIKKHEEATSASSSPRKTKRASFTMPNVTKSESRPKVHDFGEDGRSRFLQSAFRLRSKSPAKKSPAKENQAKYALPSESPSKRLDAHAQNDADVQKAAPEVLDLSVYKRRINSIRDSVAQHASLAGRVALMERTNDDQRQGVIPQSQHSFGRSSEARTSSTSNGHSKSPSGVSAVSNENDNLSEVSSAIISDAQSVSIHKSPGIADYNSPLPRKSIRPGPAPTGPLPSLPEGHDVSPPVTPKGSESSQRKPSLECSPAKSRLKTPVKGRFASGEDLTKGRFASGEDLTKEWSASSEKTSVAEQPEEMTKRPAAVVRIQASNLGAFPSPPSPERAKGQQTTVAISEKFASSVSDGHLNPRAERTKRLKERDLARERSQTATYVNDAPPPMPLKPAILDGNDRHKDSLEKLIDSYDTHHGPEQWHRLHPSLESQFSATSTWENHNSMRSSELSPIIIVADQEPAAPPQPLFVKTPPKHVNGIQNQATGLEARGFHNVVPEHHANEPASRPQPLDFVQPPVKSPQRLETTSLMQPPDKSPRRSIANRAPTPFTPNFLGRSSRRSSQRSSIVELDLEARMAAMEKKNILLERAFLAVVDASASISSGESRGRNSGQSFGTGDRFSGSVQGGFGRVDRSSGDDGEMRAGLEGLLIRQGSGRLSALKTSSGPF